MKNKEYLLFDLDGTLTDPKEGITKSVQYALKHYGIWVDDLDSLCPFIGPPLKDSFQKYYGFPEEQAKEAIQVYREYFSVKGWRENKVFPCIPEMLGELKTAGKKLYLATSKPEVFAKQILEHFGLTSYFEFIGGADLEETRVRKGDVIRYVVDTCGLSGKKEQILMVGDREHSDHLLNHLLNHPCHRLCLDFQKDHLLNLNFQDLDHLFHSHLYPSSDLHLPDQDFHLDLHFDFLG